RARPAAARGRAAQRPAVVGEAGRLGAAALDLAAHRAAGAARPGRCAPGLLRARGLRAVERPDPGPRLPRDRHARPAAAAARRPARAPTRLRGAVAAQRRIDPGPGHRPGRAEEDPFRIAGAV